jgi:hypothetical protein
VIGLLPLYSSSGKSMTIFALMLVSLVVSIVGLFWKLRMNFAGIVIHSLYNVPIVLGFIVGLTKASGFSANIIPLVILFILGLFSIYFVTLLDEENHQRKNEMITRY